MATPKLIREIKNKLPLTGGTMLGQIKLNVPTDADFDNAISVGEVEDMFYSLPTSNYYHGTGSWNGLTYTAANYNGAPKLSFTLPTGSASSLGVLKVGSNITVSNGTISIPTGSASSLGVLKVGSNISVSNGTISIPTGSTSSLGVLKVGSNISVSNGTISIPTGSTSSLGVLKVGDNITVNNGTISLTESNIINALNNDIIYYPPRDQSYLMEISSSHNGKMLVFDGCSGGIRLTSQNVGFEVSILRASESKEVYIYTTTNINFFSYSLPRGSYGDLYIEPNGLVTLKCIKKTDTEVVWYIVGDVIQGV